MAIPEAKPKLKLSMFTRNPYVKHKPIINNDNNIILITPESKINSVFRKFTKFTKNVEVSYLIYTILNNPKVINLIKNTDKFINPDKHKIVSVDEFLSFETRDIFDNFNKKLTKIFCFVTNRESLGMIKKLINVVIPNGFKFSVIMLPCVEKIILDTLEILTINKHNRNDIKNIIKKIQYYQEIQNNSMGCHKDYSSAIKVLKKKINNPQPSSAEERPRIPSSTSPAV